MRLDKWELLELRVEKLERQNRWLRAGFLLAGITVISVLTMGQAKLVNTVEAQRFVLRGAKGEARAELATIDGEYPQLTLRSSDGTKVTELSPLGVSVDDRASLSKLPLSHFGNTGLYFSDAEGKIVVEVGGASISSSQLAPVPEMKMFDSKGQVLWHAP